MRLLDLLRVLKDYDPRGSGSGVERLLAKEKVAGSNPVSRSERRQMAAFCSVRRVFLSARQGVAVAPAPRVPI